MQASGALILQKYWLPPPNRIEYSINNHFKNKKSQYELKFNVFVFSPQTKLT